MSKRFPKLQLKDLNLNEDVLLSLEHLSFDKKQYVICDLDFLSGKNFLAHANAWLQNTSHTQHFYYYALIESPLSQYEFGDDALAAELQSKWPPSLPGMHFIDCANNRVHLVLWFGDRLTGLQELMCHQDVIKDVGLREWSFDRVLIPNQIDSSLMSTVAQLSHTKTIQIHIHQLMLDSDLKKKAKLKNSPWPIGANKPNSLEKKIIIVGAGLAGAYFARIMAEDGWEVHLFDAEKSCGKIGSGNEYSVLYPKLSAYEAPITSLMHQAYPYAYWIWREILVKNPQLGRCVPLWQEMDECTDEIKAFLQKSPEWFSIADDNKSILIHHSLILNMPKLCDYLLMHPNIHCDYAFDVEDIQFENDLWRIKETTAPFCVLANGYKVGQFTQTQGLDVIGMRGQMTHIHTIHKEEMIYCSEGHFLPEWNGVHAIGASFQNQFEDLKPSDLDDEKNMKPWRDFFVNHGTFEIAGNWVGIRGVTIDHIPLVGCVPKIDEFNETYKDWKNHANKVMDSKMPNYPGLFVFAGFGSRGLLTIPLLAKFLKNMITNEPLLLSNSLLQALSAARLFKKRLSRI